MVLLRPAGGADLPAAVAAALAGTGPTVLPLPPGPAEARRVLAAMRPDVPLERADVAAVVVTSGSTGEPKGVLLTTAALRASARATHDRLGGPGRWLLALPTHHVAGLQVLVRSLLAGTDPVTLDLTGGFGADAFAAATARLRGGRRYTALVPTQLLRLLDAGAADGLASYDAVLLGGAATPAPLLDRAREAGVRVVTTYGMSETSGGCVYDGRPLDGVSVRVDDGGRIRVAGPVLFAGYRRRPDLTAAALVGGELVTNDLGRVRDGVLHVLGRADEVAVTGGEKVALAAAEAALAEHPAVAEAAAVGVPDDEWGQRLVAVVVAAGPLPRLDELRAWVAARAGRAAAPREVVTVDALPLAGPGKVDRAALRSLVPPPR